MVLQHEVSAPADDDLADVDRVLAGDTGAFENIVRRWHGPLINLAYRFCRDRGRAEDMAQQAFLRAWRGLKSWRRDAMFSTWLFALATNLYRTELRRIPVNTLVLRDVTILKAAGSVDGGLEDGHRDEAVRRAVHALPPKYREALTLFYFHNMNIQQAACSLGISEGTLKARLSRGRDILRGKLPRLLNTARFREAQ